MTISAAIKTIAKEIREDDGYREGWQANIAMSFYDAFRNSPHGPDVPHEELHEIANRAAKNFLGLLCAEPTHPEAGV